jgi:hypothetical protein
METRMLKRALLILSLLPGVSHAAGTIPGFSLTPQFDQFGKIMSGCKAGTTATPQNAYQDSGLTVALPNPLTCDATGRLPQFFLADGLIKLRLTNSAGTQQFVGDNLLVVGPSSGGGGGGGTIDPTTIATTGDFKASFTTDALTGWVRANGRTIGSSTSGATERANSDVQALFLFLWPNTTLTVSTGRGATAAADWAANKTITLPDGRGRAMAGLDDMGGTAAGRLTATYFGATGGCSAVLGTTLGAACGGESQTLTLAQLPTGITTIGTIVVNAGGGGGGIVIAPPGNATSSIQYPLGGGSGFWGPAVPVASWGAIGNLQGLNQTMTSNNTSNASHPEIQPTILITYYIKL